MARQHHTGLRVRRTAWQVTLRPRSASSPAHRKRSSYSMMMGPSPGPRSIAPSPSVNWSCHAEALAVCAKPQAPYEPEWVINGNRAQALATAAQGSLESALTHANTAVHAAEPSEYLNYRAAALADRASIHDLLNRTADALADLEAALALYQRKGNVVEAGRIRKRLADRT